MADPIKKVEGNGLSEWWRNLTTDDPNSGWYDTWNSDIPDIQKFINTGDYAGYLTDAKKNSYPTMAPDKFQLAHDASSKDAAAATTGYMGTILGTTKLVLGGLSFLDTQKNSKLNRKILKQKYASNGTTMRNMNADRAHAINTFRVG